MRVPSIAEEFTIPLTAATAGTALAARVYGNAERIPVLALHGWLDNAASFERLAPLLDWAHVVALDLPGHGLSERRSADSVYALIDYVPDVLRAADALGWKSFVLLGHSLGGSVACLTAGTAPERIRALLLVDALGALTAPAEEAPQRLQHHMEAKQRLLSKPAPSYPNLEAALAARMRAGRFDDPVGVRAMVERGLKTEIRDGKQVLVWRADGRLTLPSPHRLTVDHVVAFMKRIACPTILVRPDGGLAFDPKTTAAYLKAVPDIVVRETAGGHHVHLDRPESVAALFKDVPKRLGV